MERTVRAIVIAGLLALSFALPNPVVAASPVDVPAAAPEATSALPCTGTAGRLLLAEAGCCEQRGGVCGCRNGTPKCCNGTMGNGCSCQSDAPDGEAALTDAL